MSAFFILIMIYDDTILFDYKNVPIFLVYNDVTVLFVYNDVIIFIHL